jgi:hypothetical protein
MTLARWREIVSTVKVGGEVVLADWFPRAEHDSFTAGFNEVERQAFQGCSPILCTNPVTTTLITLTTLFVK